MFAVTVVLIVAVLFLAATAHNTVNKSWQDGDYTVIGDVVYEQIEKADAPTGIVNEYRFTLDRIGHADALVFYVNHHNIEVYLADECVYRMAAANGSFQTPGSVWTMIPLCENDTGKEIRVVLSPLYRNYQKEVPNFLLGSELAIYKAAFYQALPELVLSLCVVFTGLFLL